MKRFIRVLLVVVAVLLGVALVGPFLVPIPPLKDTVPPEDLADADSRFIQVNGLRVHYKLAGQGQRVLLLLHGFASSLFSWRNVMGPLAEGATVVAFDRPAFGLTERPLPGRWAGQNPYSLDAQVDLTVALMDELGLAKVVLVGNSAGGTVAFATALRYPQRVEALVLVDPAIYVGGGSPGWLQPLLHTPQMRHLGPLLVRNVQRWGKTLAETAWHDPSRITPDVWAGYLKPLQADNWDQGLWQFTLAGRSPGLDRRLGELQVPALVITGDDDRVVPTADSIRLAQELPGAGLVVVPNCGHVPHEECPQAFLQAVDAFLNGKHP